MCKLNSSHQKQGKNYDQQNKITCYRCGSLSHKANSPNCMAKSVICNQCHKKGHLQRVCKAKLKSDQKSHYGNIRATTVNCNAVEHNHTPTTAGYSDSTEKLPPQPQSVKQFSVFAIGASGQDHNVLLNGKKLLCVVDTGT